MSKILKVKNVSDYSRHVGATDFHPWVNVIDFAEVSPVHHCLNNYGVYGTENTIIIKEHSFV